MELSNRLKAVASLVEAGSRVVDIGTDHAYIPIYLIQKNQAVSVIAVDCREGPLLRAAEHVKSWGLEEKIRLRLSDGFQKLSASEADTAVLSGMGGGLIIRILKAYPEVTLRLKSCILQPQSEIAKVRTFLLEEGFLFLQEDMVKEDGKYYPMMKVAPPKNENQEEGINDTDRKKPDWSEAELQYGKLLLEMRHPVLKEYLEKEFGIRKRILEQIRGQSGERIAERRKELNREIESIRKGLEYYAVQ